MVALDEYRAIRGEPDLLLTAPGHAADRASLHKETPGYEIRRRPREHGDGDADLRSA